MKIIYEGFENADIEQFEDGKILTQADVYKLNDGSLFCEEIRQLFVLEEKQNEI